MGLQAVFFKMRVAGVLHIFQFDTKQGEDICMALQTHINDIMMKRYSKVGSLLPLLEGWGGGPQGPLTGRRSGVWDCVGKQRQISLMGELCT